MSSSIGPVSSASAESVAASPGRIGCEGTRLDGLDDARSDAAISECKRQGRGDDSLPDLGVGTRDEHATRANRVR